MFERPQAGADAVLVHLAFGRTSTAAEQQEFTELAHSAGARTLALVTGSRKDPEPRFLIGAGKADAVKALVAAHGANVVLVYHRLSPSQERNLEKHVGCRVVDRTGLILDIFAQRAQSFEGKLQVELAQLKHLATRLVRGWTHLERQKGGIGLRGPGETQLETDRRLIGKRIATLESELARVRARRGQNRRARKRADCITIALVGYTNTGKSTLFNRLSGAQTYAADRLFATLDPKVRRIEVAGVGPVVVIDTVGFIRDLPHDLVAAFRGTLEETLEADLLLHLIDAADDDNADRIAAVDAVLAEIGAASIPAIQVFNKIDRCDLSARVERGAEGRVARVWMSARSGAGADLLHGALTEFAQARTDRWEIRTSPAQARERAQLYAQGVVVAERTARNGDSILEVRLDGRQKGRLAPGLTPTRLPRAERSAAAVVE